MGRIMSAYITVNILCHFEYFLISRQLPPLSIIEKPTFKAVATLFSKLRGYKHLDKADKKNLQLREVISHNKTDLQLNRQTIKKAIPL
jgi:hypothetical protein